MAGQNQVVRQNLKQRPDGKCQTTKTRLLYCATTLAMVGTHSSNAVAKVAETYILEWKEDEQNGARRSAGAPKKSWSRLVAKESWEKLQSWRWSKQKISESNIDFESWKKGECWRWLRLYAMYARQRSMIVDFVSSS